MYLSAVSFIKRAAWRDCESSSPPTLRRVLASCGDSFEGTPSEKTRTVRSSRVPSAPVDHPDAERRHVPFSRLLYKARELARLRVVLAADAAARVGLLRRLVRGHALGEDAHGAVVARAVRAGGASDDVVGEHRVHVHVLLLRLLGEVGR